MERYHFTLRFDDELHSLTRFNGLPMQRVGELLVSLSDALGLGKSQQLVLSEVRGNCYALELTTESVVLHESLKVIHQKISNNEYLGLNTEQRKYAHKLKVILGDKLYLKAYDKDKSYEVRVEKIELPPMPAHYYEVGNIYGVITSIGSNTLEGKTHIRINQEDYQIEISAVQEKALLSEYKKNRLLLSVRKKINFETDKIISAELLDFEVLIGQDFAALAESFREKFPDAFPEDEVISVSLSKK